MPGVPGVRRYICSGSRGLWGRESKWLAGRDPLEPETSSAGTREVRNFTWLIASTSIDTQQRKAMFALTALMETPKQYQVTAIELNVLERIQLRTGVCEPSCYPVKQAVVYDAFLPCRSQCLVFSC